MGKATKYMYYKKREEQNLAVQGILSGRDTGTLCAREG